MTKKEFFETCIKHGNHCETCPYYDKEWAENDKRSWCSITNRMTYQDAHKLHEEYMRYKGIKKLQEQKL